MFSSLSLYHISIIIVGVAPQAKPLYEAVITALNQKEAEKGND